MIKRRTGHPAADQCPVALRWGAEAHLSGNGSPGILRRGNLSGKGKIRSGNRMESDRSGVP